MQIFATEIPDWCTNFAFTVAVILLAHKFIGAKWMRRESDEAHNTASGTVLDSSWEERKKKILIETGTAKTEAEASTKSLPSSSTAALVINATNLVEWEDIRSKSKSTGRHLIVKFTATWCGPCKRIDPAYISLARKYISCAFFVRIDVDELFDISEEYGVVSMPTFVVIFDDNEVGRLCGSSEMKLEQFIDHHCNNTSGIEKNSDSEPNEIAVKDGNSLNEEPLSPSKGKGKGTSAKISKASSSQPRPRGAPGREIQNQHRQERSEEERPPLKSSVNHPGLSEFHNYYSAMSDLYRQYIIGSKTGEVPAPIIPRSERGLVNVRLEVLNSTSSPIDAFWIDYKGTEEWKGSVYPGQYWTQTTYIGHPWTFRAQGGHILLHYVPYRVIPTTDKSSTVTRNGEAIQRFTILKPSYLSMAQDLACDVRDDVLPHPPQSIKSIDEALNWSYRQMERDGTNPRTIIKYLYNIVYNPSDPKYRQIRTANKIFWQEIWCNAGRGVLHALGFQEIEAYAEMGPAIGTLSSERMKQVSRVISDLENLLAGLEGTGIQQPEGADGYGRAGFGRVGMN